MVLNQRQVRKIVRIDEEKCNGCGECVPSCAEGAIRIVNGKARLVAENLCDGLGACLGHCPMDAIRVEERLADTFDHRAVEAHLSKPATAPRQPEAPQGACPGAQMRFFAPAACTPGVSTASAAVSMLGQWPVQLTLLPITGPMWNDAHLLLSADCVPFAYPDFHQTMLAGRTLAIACPKLDNCEPYIQKLAQILAGNSIRSITIARMEVPCCCGLVRVVEKAKQLAGREDIPVDVMIFTIRGQLRVRQ